MPFVIDYSSPAAMGSAAVLAGQAQGDWANVKFAADQNQLATENAQRAQQIFQQQQQAQAQNDLERQRMALDDQYRKLQLQSQSDDDKALNDYRNRVISSQNDRNTLNNQTRTTIATNNAQARSNDLLTKLGQQNDQFLQKIGLSRDRLNSINQFRQNTTDARVAASERQYQVDMANAMTNEQRLQVTMKHAADLDAYRQQDLQQRTNQFNTAQTNQSARFNAGQTNQAARQTRAQALKRLDFLLGGDANSIAANRAEILALQQALSTPATPTQITPTTLPATTQPAAQPAAQPFAPQAMGPFMKPPAAPAPFNPATADQTLPSWLMMPVSQKRELSDDQLQMLVYLLQGAQPAAQWLQYHGYDTFGKPIRYVPKQG